jgi:hypothetical protein
MTSEDRSDEGVFALGAYQAIQWRVYPPAPFRDDAAHDGRRPGVRSDALGARGCPSRWSSGGQPDFGRGAHPDGGRTWL